MPRSGKPRGKVVYRRAHVQVNYEHNHKGVAAIAVSPNVFAALNQIVVREAMPYAMSISPVYLGTYRASFELRNDVVRVSGRAGRMARASAQLHNTAPHALAVEWGNKAFRGRGNGYRVLARTLAYLHATAHLT